MLLTTVCSSEQTTLSTAHPVRTARKDAQERSQAAGVKSILEGHILLFAFLLSKSQKASRTWSKWLNRLLHWQSPVLLPLYIKVVYKNWQMLIKKIKKTTKTKQEDYKTICCCNISSKNYISAFSAILPSQLCSLSPQYLTSGFTKATDESYWKEKGYISQDKHIQ